MMTVPIAKSNCWTCKERKVGCDRALPACANCTRAKRDCKGYGLKLAWPDKFDGRRKQKKYQAEPDASATHYVTRFGEFCFLNTGMDDIERQQYTVRDLAAMRIPSIDLYASSSVPGSLNFWELNLDERDGALLGYYDAVVARMATTIDDSTNGFRHELMPMALTSTDEAATSLLQATLALASFHLGNREEALSHKVKAIKALSGSFHGGSLFDEGVRKRQFASCMMLCQYSVFDASDTSWHTHLQGARNIATNYRRAQVLDDQHTCSSFLKDWYEYHQTFSEFTYPFQFYSALPSIQDIVLPESILYDRRVVGVSGCSPELLRLISCINQLRTLLSMKTCSSGPDMMALAVHLRMRLMNLRQQVHIYTDEYTGHISHTRINLTAEFYRLAAILYLYNTYPAAAPTISPSGSPGSPHPFPSIPTLVHQAFMLLDQMDVCHSPWPLFVVACNVVEDRQRIEVIRIFEEGSRERRAGNYDVIMELVKAVWKRGDLNCDESRDRSTRIPDWRQLVNMEMGMPAFI